MAPGVETVIEAALPEAMSLAGIAAVNCVELMYEVGSGLPARFTTEAGTKLPPVTVSMNPEPAVTLAGKTPEMTGSGLLAAKASVEFGPSPPMPVAETT